MDQTLLDGRQVRRIPILVEASAVTPWHHLRAYEGLEGPLRPSERLRAEANERYDEVAAARWATSEANDPDLKEAGFERLGDLVAANSLTGPGPEDTFRHLSQAQEPEEP